MPVKDAKTYRDALLQAGVGVKIDTRKLDPSKIAKAPKNPSCAVHGIDVEDVLACGVFQHDKGGGLLVLPPRQGVFEAVVDFLRFEAMRGKETRNARHLANKIEALGVSLGILGNKKFTKDAMTVVVDDEDTQEREEIPASAEVIDCWGVHKEPDRDENDRWTTTTKWCVTHAPTGRSVACDISKVRAAEIAKKLAKSDYPWRLFTSGSDAKPEWKDAIRFVASKITKSNPGCARHRIHPVPLFEGLF